MYYYSKQRYLNEDWKMCHTSRHKQVSTYLSYQYRSSSTSINLASMMTSIPLQGMTGRKSRSHEATHKHRMTCQHRRTPTHNRWKSNLEAFKSISLSNRDLKVSRFVGAGGSRCPRVLFSRRAPTKYQIMQAGHASIPRFELESRSRVGEPSPRAKTRLEGRTRSKAWSGSRGLHRPHFFSPGRAWGDRHSAGAVIFLTVRSWQLGAVQLNGAKRTR